MSKQSQCRGSLGLGRPCFERSVRASTWWLQLAEQEAGLLKKGPPLGNNALRTGRQPCSRAGSLLFARAVCVPPFRGGNTKFFKSQTQKCPMPKNRDMHDNVQCEQDCTNTSQNAWHSRMQRTSLFFLVGGDCHITGSYSDSGRKQPSGRNQPITSIWIPPVTSQRQYGL